MKKISVNLPDELYKKLEGIPNKSEYIRNILMKELEKTEDRTEDIPEEEKHYEIEHILKEICERNKYLEAELIRIAKIVNAVYEKLKRKIDELEKVKKPTAEKEDEETERMKKIIACIPKGKAVKRGAVERLLAKRYEDITAIISKLIKDGVVKSEVRNGEEYIWR